VPATQLHPIRDRTRKSRSGPSPAYFRRENAKLALLVAALMLPFGWGFEWSWGRMARDAEAAHEWPQVAGVITESFIANGGSNKFSPSGNVRYTFEVDGRTYEGENISLSVAALDAEDARSVVARYPVGKRIDVFYDPERPGEASALEQTDPDFWDHLLLGLGTFLRWCGALLVLVACQQYRASLRSAAAG
jgi:hypothetical protein